MVENREGFKARREREGFGEAVVRKSVCQLKGCETGGASAFELALAGV